MSNDCYYSTRTNSRLMYSNYDKLQNYTDNLILDCSPRKISSSSTSDMQTTHKCHGTLAPFVHRRGQVQRTACAPHTHTKNESVASPKSSDKLHYQKPNQNVKNHFVAWFGRRTKDGQRKTFDYFCRCCLVIWFHSASCWTLILAGNDSISFVSQIIWLVIWLFAFNKSSPLTHYVIEWIYLCPSRWQKVNNPTTRTKCMNRCVTISGFIFASEFICALISTF